MDAVTTDKEMASLKPGDEVRLFFCNNSQNNCLYHVVDFVVDRQMNQELIVTKKWSWRWRRWIYEVNPLELGRSFYPYLTVDKRRHA